jgi:hypothetical protein
VGCKVGRDVGLPVEGGGVGPVGCKVGRDVGVPVEGWGVGRNDVGLLDVGCEVGAWSARSIERVGFGVGLRVDGFDVGSRVNILSTVGI